MGQKNACTKQTQDYRDRFNHFNVLYWQQALTSGVFKEVHHTEQRAGAPCAATPAFKAISGRSKRPLIYVNQTSNSVQRGSNGLFKAAHRSRFLKWPHDGEHKHIEVLWKSGGHEATIAPMNISAASTTRAKMLKVNLSW